jgi:PEGA domain
MGISIIISLFLTVVPLANRKVAVFEYRAGVSEQPDFTKRVVSLLRSKSNLDIISSRDGRRILGSRFDQMISTCKDSIQCVARLGKKLKVDEVILIALTEFGTVLISTSRIIVRKAKVRGSADIDVTAGGSITKLQIYKLLKKLFPKNYFKRRGTLLIKSNIKGAKVYLNKKMVGKTPIPSMKLAAPKKYKIKVTSEGYIPFKADFRLVPKGNLEIFAELSPLSTQQVKVWYKKPWVWAVAGGILTSIAITTWYLTNSPSTVPVTIQIPNN